MSFQKSALLLRARLHLGKVHPALLVGVIVAAVAVLVCIGIGLVQATSAGQLSINHASEQHEASDGGSTETASEGTEDQTAAEPPLICVHVSGAVASPGVCYLPEGSRAADAVEAAGGFAEGAAEDSLNLARILADGEQLIVARTDELVATNPSPGAAAPAPANAKININTATSEELQELDGVGEATAEKIIKEREENGPFATVEDIMRVPGIGEKKFEAMRDDITVQ